MNINRKLTLILIIVVLLPIAVALINGYLAETVDLRWSKDNLDQISFWSFVVSILGCLLIIYFNYISGFKKSFWYTLPIFLAITLATFLYVGYSFSNFGF